MDKAKEICLDKIFSKLYKDAVPLNDDYKTTYGDNLDTGIKDYISRKCPNGILYYVHEAIKKGNPIAKK